MGQYNYDYFSWMVEMVHGAQDKHPGGLSMIRLVVGQSIEHFKAMKTNQLGWIVGAMGVVLVLGFVSGRVSVQDKRTSEKKADTQDRRTLSSTRAARKSGSASTMSENRNRNGKSGSSQDAQRKMKILLNRMEQNPMVSMDFDGMFELWEIVRDFSEDDVRDALLSMDDIKNKQLQMTMNMILMSRWGKIDGAAAMQHVVDSDTKQAKMMGSMGVMMSWAKEDPEGAFAWYEENGKKLGGRGVYDSMMYQELAKHDLSRALSKINALDSRNQKLQALSGIGRGVVNEPEKLKTLIAFLDAEGDTKTKSEVMASVIQNMAIQDPESAQACLQTIEDEEEKKKQTENLIRSWSYHDPKAAITWGLEQATDEETEVKIVESYLNNWARQDAQAAGAWYDQQESHLKTSKAVKNSVRNLYNGGDYQQAFAWAAREDDPEKGNKLKRDIYQTWVKDSPNMAESWINGDGRDVMDGVDLTDKEADQSYGTE